MFLECYVVVEARLKAIGESGKEKVKIIWGQLVVEVCILSVSMSKIDF